MTEIKFNYPPIETVSTLIDQMTKPTPRVRQAIREISGEIMILGVGGKMGPTLAELAVRAGAKIIGVDIFPQPEIKNYLDDIGIRTITCDLFDERQLAALPDVGHIILMAGTKFGSTANQPFTWAMNALLPARIVQRFPTAKIIYLSSGNVYKFVPVPGPGATEGDALEPIGEYAMSRLGGERLVQFITQKNQTACCMVRLFYATELRYGIIHDLAQKIKAGETIDLSMGYFNQIWQGDANAYLLQCFSLCTTPARVINLTGPEILSVRIVAQRLGELMGIAPKFVGAEDATALLGDASLVIKQFGPPAVTADQIIEWVAWWVMHGGESLGKPTKFERRDGKF
ncbi:MAG: NAD(P)-dependent oxidoreductase [candidate division KSB1 bacterium]|nr:NAD(P)-dependent oxidoreductase [candidate division KSB1 bacterium]